MMIEVWSRRKQGIGLIWKQRKLRTKATVFTLFETTSKK